MYMTFDCNPQIIFVTFSQFELSHFWLNFYIRWYLLNATPPTILAGSFLKTLQVFLSRFEDVHDV